jgi:hypothetical protein
MVGSGGGHGLTGTATAPALDERNHVLALEPLEVLQRLGAGKDLPALCHARLVCQLVIGSLARQIVAARAVARSGDLAIRDIARLRATSQERQHEQAGPYVAL